MGDENHYRQTEEFQTLVIANDNGKYPVTGTFKLTFTDQFGDEWTTRDIPTQVRLSVPGTLASEAITFQCFSSTGAIEAVEVYGDTMTGLAETVGAAAFSATSGSGTGAQFEFVTTAATPTAITSVTLTNKGSGFKVGDLVSFLHNTANTVTFLVTKISANNCGEDEGLPKEELSVGDFIKVNGVTFQVANSKTSTKALASAH